MITPPHNGPRLVSRPYFDNAFWGRKLPANVMLDANSVANLAELRRQVTLATTNVNIAKWTTAITLVDGSTPKVPVTLRGQAATWWPSLGRILARGVPIPNGFKATNDSDAHAVMVEPSFQSGDDWGRVGRTFEYWGLLKDYAGYPGWSCGSAGRIFGLNVSPGHYRERTDVPDTNQLFEQDQWGANAAGLAHGPGILTVEDFKMGYVGHALRMSVITAGRGFRWPAAKSSDAHGTNALLQYGTRLRIAPDAVMPAGLHPIAQLVWQAARDYGVVISDQAGSVCFYGEPGMSAYLGTSAEWQILQGFPWQDLQVLATGSDVMPNPLA